MSKTALKWSKASGSTKRRVEQIIRAGERGTRRALPSAKRREFLERVGEHE
jgi:hypothetical protein